MLVFNTKLLVNFSNLKIDLMLLKLSDLLIDILSRNVDVSQVVVPLEEHTNVMTLEQISLENENLFSQQSSFCSNKCQTRNET